jgi:hypothetical protein
MAFGFIKEVVKGVGSLGQVAYSIARKTPLGTVKLALDWLAPGPVRKVGNIVIAVAKEIPAVKSLINKIGGKPMNPIEEFLRNLAKFGQAMADGIQISDANELVDLVMSTGSGFQAYNSANAAGKAKMTRDALDACWGTEPNALIGPDGTLAKVDIPLVDDEKVSDVFLDAGEAYMLKKLEAEAPKVEG